MVGNWMEIKGHKIAIPSEIQFQLNSPFNDKDVFVDGTKTNKRGEFTQPFTSIMSFEDLYAIGMPHLLQKAAVTEQIPNVSIYSNGAHIDTGLLIITDCSINFNSKEIECQFLFFYAAAEFVSIINKKKVNELLLDGKRFRAATDSIGNWGTIGPSSIHFDPTPFTLWVDGSGVSKYRNTWFYDHPNEMYVNSTNISDYATDIVNDGDEYICFPSVKALNDSSTPEGFRWINHWDTTFHKMYSTLLQFKKIYPDGPPIIYDDYTIATIHDYNNSLVPMYFYHQVLRHCFSELGFNLITSGSIIEDEHFKKIAIVNNYDIKEYWIGYGVGIGSKHDASPGVIDFTNYGDGKGIEATLAYYEKDVNIDPKNHLPDCTIKDFILDFMNKFNVQFEFNGKNVTIKKGEFETIDREIKDYNPKILTKILHDNVGVSLKYEFTSDKTYDTLKKWDKQLTSLIDAHDSAEIIAVPDDVLFCYSPRNQVQKGIPGILPEYQCENFIPYISGTGKEITLILPPVSMSNGLDTYELINPLVLPEDLKTQIPIIDIPIVRKGYDTILFKFNSIGLYTGGSVDFVREFYDTEQLSGDVRSGENDFKLGFYYGLNGLIQEPSSGTPVTNSRRYPCMTSHCYIEWNEDKQGWFNLSLLGEDGLVEQFLLHFLEIHNSKKQITFQAYESIRITKSHKYYRALLIRGVKVYASQINFNAPNYEGVQYIGYVLDQFSK